MNIFGFFRSILSCSDPAMRGLTQLHGDSESAPDSKSNTAVVFIHGLFSQSKNFDKDLRNYKKHGDFKKKNWDFYLYQYKSDPILDRAGKIKDPDLEEIANDFITSFTKTLKNYENLFLVGQSMGGLILQRALTKSEELRDNTSGVFLCATPSQGIRLSKFPHGIFHRQVRNMSSSGKFMKGLRSAWDESFKVKEGTYEFPFFLRAIAGEKDELVSPSSVLSPFPKETWGVNTYNHIDTIELSLGDIACSIQQYLDGEKIPQLTQPLPPPIKGQVPPSLSTDKSFTKQEGKMPENSSDSLIIVENKSTADPHKTLSVPYVHNTFTASTASSRSMMIATDEITVEPEIMPSHHENNYTEYTSCPNKLLKTLQKTGKERRWKKIERTFHPKDQRGIMARGSIEKVGKNHITLRTVQKEIIPGCRRDFVIKKLKYPIANIYGSQKKGVLRTTLEMARQAGNDLEIDEPNLRLSSAKKTINVRFHSDTWKYKYTEPVNGTFCYSWIKNIPPLRAFHALPNKQVIKIPVEELARDTGLSHRDLTTMNGKNVRIAFQDGKVSFKPIEKASPSRTPSPTSLSL